MDWLGLQQVRDVRVRMRSAKAPDETREARNEVR
jgi:hypothetical protein